MCELNEFKSYFDELNKRVTYSTPFPELKFIQPEIDIELDPEHFLNWLKKENSEDFEDDKDYSFNVASMCEYSCLYVAMMLHKKQLKGDLKIMCGNFGFWEHYWLKYTLNGVSYYLDLTLQQFIREAPKFSITIANEDPTGYNTVCDGESIKDYINGKMGFEFYVNPNEV